MQSTTLRRTVLAALVATCAVTAQAADWSDTSIGYAYGQKFAEPFITDDIAKSIVNLTHASGYKYGSNFLNADLLLSDSKDPAAPGSRTGAHEAYVVYRHTLDIGAVTGTTLKLGPVKGFGVTAGFDFNTKNDAGYNSQKRMLVAGPTLMLDVPGYLNISLLALWESNAPYSKFSNTQTERYSYDVHPMLNFVWGTPVPSTPLWFEGFANFIASKGTDEFGGKTAPETLIDARLMYDLSPALGAPKNTFKIGAQYQYWKNKFGNDHKGPAGAGAFAKTPMVRAEYHF